MVVAMTLVTGMTILMIAAMWVLLVWWVVVEVQASRDASHADDEDDDGGGGIRPLPTDPLGPEPGVDWASWMNLETHERDEVPQ